MSQRSFERTAQRRQDAEARRDTLRRRRLGLASGAAGAAALLAPAAASADTFEVTSLAGDDGAGTLRDAVQQASTSPEDSTVTFASNVRGTIALGSGIFHNGSTGGGLTIQGPGANLLTITSTEFGILGFAGTGSTPVAVSGLTLTGGGNLVGGAITAGDVDLTVRDTVVTNSQAILGGGIGSTNGSLTLTGVKVTGNRATGVPGTKYDSGAGGGVFAGSSDLTVNGGSQITGNEAVAGEGGGISVGKFNDARGGQRGGLPSGPSDGSVTIEDSSVSSNLAATGGGASIQTTEEVSISRSTVADNTAYGTAESYRGGDRGILPENGITPGIGGGVANFSFSDFTVEDSTVSGNRALVPTVPDEDEDPPTETETETAPTDTGPTPTETTTVDTDIARGADTPTNAPADGVGGGIFAFTFSDGLISNSTVSGNAAGIGGGVFAFNFASGLPGGLRAKVPAIGQAERSLKRGDVPEGSISVDNSTVSANTASEIGGGLLLPGGEDDTPARGDVDAPPVTVPDEEPEEDTVTNPSISSTIAAGNTSGGDDPDISNGGVGGTIDSSYSLIQDKGTANVADDASQPTIFGQAAQLGGLTNNGGPTQTMLPGAGSPAIDKGIANGLTTDQRGFARIVDLSPPNQADGTDIGAVEVPAPVTPGSTPGRPVTSSSIPASCGRRIISLVDARVKGDKVVLKGLVGAAYYGKKVTIQTDPEGAKASGFTKTMSVTASKKSGAFTATVPKPSKDDYITIRYRALAGKAKSPALKLPQSLTLKSVKSAKGTITVQGKVKKSLLGKRNKVTIRRLACGRYRTMGSVKPDADGNYKLTFKTTSLRGVALYRAEASVQARPGSKKYVKQYARAVAIKTTGQTG